MTSTSTDENSEPITLSWSNTLQTEVSNPTSDLDAATFTPSESPPGYSAVRTPTSTLRYTFSQLGSNSMLLVPPSTAPDTRPQYYITTNTNVFMPHAHVTSVYRGSNEYGEMVGEFEAGIMATTAKIQIKSVNCAIQTILQRRSGSSSETHTWYWIPPESQKQFTLKWEYPAYKMEAARAQCTSLTSGKPKTHLATFYFPLPSSTKLYGETALEVTVAGQEYFDHILMSLLLCERRRLSPKFSIKSGKDLWIFNL